MAAHSDDVERQVRETETRHIILNKLFDKLANNRRTAADEKMASLDEAFRQASDRSMSASIAAACLTYQKLDSFFNRHTQLDIAAKILTQALEYPDSDFPGQAIMPVILLMDDMVQLYVDLDNDRGNPYDYMPDGVYDFLKDNTPAIDRVSYDSTLFFYIREAINRSVDNIFNHSANDILSHIESLSSSQLSIFIHLLSLRDMYVNKRYERICFRLMYRLAKDYRLDYTHQQLIGEAYKKVDADEGSELQTSIDRLLEFIHFQSMMDSPDSSELLEIQRFINHILTLFDEPYAPEDLSDVFDKLTLTQYQSLTQALFSLWQRTSNNIDAPLRRCLQNQRFWRALLNKATTLRESNADSISGDFITWLIYYRPRIDSAWLIYQPVVSVVWQVILNEPRFHIWLEHLLRIDRATGIELAGRATQSITDLTPAQESAFVNELAQTLPRGTITQMFAQGVRSPLLLATWRQKTILAMGALLLTALKLGYIQPLSLAHTEGFKHTEEFQTHMFKWISALFETSRFDALSEVIAGGYVTNLIVRIFISLYCPMWQSLGQRLFDTVADEYKGQLIRTFLYQRNQTGNALVLQPTFPVMVTMLWSYDMSSLHRASYLACMIPAGTSDLERLSVIKEMTLLSDTAEIRSVFQVWWSAYQDSFILNMGTLKASDRENVILLTANFILKLVEQVSWHGKVGNHFWRDFIANVGIKLTGEFLQMILSVGGQQWMLTNTYRYLGRERSLIDIYHVLMHQERDYFDTKEALISLFALNKKQHKFDSKDWLTIFSLFFRDDVSANFISVVSHYIDALFDALIAVESSYRERGYTYRERRYDGCEMLEPIERGWRWLLSHVPHDICYKSLSRIQEQGSVYQLLIFKNCYIGFHLSLEALGFYSEFKGFKRLLRDSLQAGVNIQFFLAILPFIDLDSLEEPEDHSVIQQAMSRGLIYVQHLLSHYRLLKGDLDLSTAPSTESVGQFLTLGCMPHRNLLYHAATAIHEAVAKANYIEVTLWLLDLAEPVIAEILQDEDTYHALSAKRSDVLDIRVWLLRKGHLRQERSSGEIKPSPMEEREYRAVMDYKKEPDSIALISTELGIALRSYMLSKKSSFLGVRCLAGAPPDEVAAFFVFDAALTRELDLREQSLNQWLQWLQPKSRLRQDLVQALATHSEGVSPCEQAIQQLIDTPTGLSQQGLLLLRTLWEEVNSVRLEEASTVSSSSSSDEGYSSRSSGDLPRWIVRFLLLTKTQRARGSQAECSSTSMQQLHDQKPPPSISSCPQALYRASSSSASSSTGPSPSSIPAPTV